MNDLLFLDTETTDLPEKGRLIDLAYATIAEPTPRHMRVRPPCPIDIEAMSIHHITESAVINHPFFVEHPDRERVTALIENRIVVAHNAKFDIEILKKEGIEVNRYIDTKRVAMHLFPEQKRFGLQYLRYALALPSIADEMITPHTAVGDVWVTMALWERIERKLGKDPVAEAMELSQKPVLVTYCTQKKHAGKTYEEIFRTDRDYLVWMLGKDFGEDVNYTVKHWLRVGT